jgi:hypothetical protein
MCFLYAGSRAARSNRDGFAIVLTGDPCVFDIDFDFEFLFLGEWWSVVVVPDEPLLLFGRGSSGTLETERNHAPTHAASVDR